MKAYKGQSFVFTFEKNTVFVIELSSECIWSPPVSTSNRDL